MDRNYVYRKLMDIYNQKVHQSHIKRAVYELLEKYKNSQQGERSHSGKKRQPCEENNTTKATIALFAKCHAEIEIVANRIDNLRKLQGEIKAGIAQQ